MGLGANDIYRWKAVDLSFSNVRAKIDFLQPSDRQNFANALGQTCILDLRLRLTKNLSCCTKALLPIRFSGKPQERESAVGKVFSFTLSIVVKR